MRIARGVAAWIAVSTSFATPVTFVGVNFGENAEPSPTNWTLVTGPGTSSNLIDNLGAPTSISITVSGTPSTFAGTPAAGSIPSDAPTLTNLQSNFYSFGASTTLLAEFTGLTPNATYSVYAIGIRFGGPISQTVTITGSGSAMFTQNSVVANSLLFNGSVGSSSQTLESYAAGVQASGSGTVSILFTSGGSLYSVAGVAISLGAPIAALPLPNSLLLVVAALLVTVLFYFARRRLAAGS